METTKVKSLIEKRFKVDIESHIWITARGRRVPVRQMNASHIRNCINCWEGTGRMRIPAGYLGGKEKWLGIFNRELENRN